VGLSLNAKNELIGQRAANVLDLPMFCHNRLICYQDTLF
jgi:hypothetical protein